MKFEYNQSFALNLDNADPLRAFRERFYFPMLNEEPVVYFTGNSLGLQPKTAQEYILDELEDWASFGVEGHVHARNPWTPYHEWFAGPLSRVVGAKETEVVAMNQLTVNLHLLMVSFYRPTAQRYKIICEARAFPSDQYAIASQVRFHGFDPSTAVIEVAPRKGEYLLRDEDILNTIREHGKETALVLFGGINYLSGQFFDLEAITRAAHEAGAVAGFDLAHAAGNVRLNLHHWNVDFACWCSYKYLNSGPGSVAGAFIHEKHHAKDLPMFAGWWGHNKKDRFLMGATFDPIPTAEAWQLSNAPVLIMAAHRASLELFEQAGMERLVEKQHTLTGYLEFLIRDLNVQLEKNEKAVRLEIITPLEKERRGCQLSIVAHGAGKELFTRMIESGIIADWREPNVIRVAPAPIYNSYEDCYRFRKILGQLLGVN
ncbi:MAG: kynureninase [Bacteroidia bacterium]|nr:kynureninase [Bacteroidia bacterium]